jgi:hypothetical protein
MNRNSLLPVWESDFCKGGRGMRNAGGDMAPHLVRTESRTSVEEGSASEPKSHDDCYARCDLKCFQSYHCGLYGHFRRECRRGREGCPGSGQNQSNGIGKAN